MSRLGLMDHQREDNENDNEAGPNQTKDPKIVPEEVIIGNDDLRRRPRSCPRRRSCGLDRSCRRGYWCGHDSIVPSFVLYRRLINPRRYPMHRLPTSPISSSRTARWHLAGNLPGIGLRVVRLNSRSLYRRAPGIMALTRRGDE